MSAAGGARRGGALACGLPRGRRTPRGRLRWYLVQVPEGRERSVCEALRRLVPEALLEDAFCPAKERWMKRAGSWFTSEVLMYRGFLFAATRDAAGLDRELSGLSLPARLVGSQGRSWAPIDDGAAAWLSAAMDGEHVIRSSTAWIVGGELCVQSGPLVGQEDRVSKVDRHRRTCLVRVSDADGGLIERMPIDVPFKG